MSEAGPKLRRVSEGRKMRGFAHWCPACDEAHVFAVDQPFDNGAKWTFDGNLLAPTFNPSMNIRTGKYVDPKHVDHAGWPASSICHYFLRAGVIEYLGDCTHAMKGQKVPLPDLPPHLRDR